MKYFKKLSHYTYLPLFLLLLAFVSANQWSEIPLGNTFTTWTICTLVLIAFFIEYSKSKLGLFYRQYAIVGVFLLWAIIGIIRGCFTAENYWEWKNLYSTSLVLLMPLCVYVFRRPAVVCYTLKFWLFYGLSAYAVFFFWVVGISQFYLGPLYLLICFIPIIRSKIWKVILIVFAILLLTYDIQDQRSQFIKAVISVSLAIGVYFRNFIGKIILRTTHLLLFIIPIIFLYLGISGHFNIFESTEEEYSGRYISKGEEHVDMSADTRTFIYYEVITSAVDNGYVILGRTPARGNDATFFYDTIDDLKYQRQVDNLKIERIRNEVCFPNIFTWLGLIGMLLYIGIYLCASIMAVYFSNNIYVRLLGIYVAFNFLYGWVENCTSFDILNFEYWIMNSICLSGKFRKMTDQEFNIWLNKCFPKL